MFTKFLKSLTKQGDSKAYVHDIQCIVDKVASMLYRSIFGITYDVYMIG